MRVEGIDLKLIKKSRPKVYAEIGIDKGDTVLEVCRVLEEGAEIHLFDFKRKTDNVQRKISDLYGGKFTVRSFGVEKQNYCWDLMKLVAVGRRIYDYVYLDGAHDLTIDGFAFYLIDRLLNPGGYIEFDDYDWTFGESPTCSPYPPVNNAKIGERYTREQLDTPHIKLIVDNLVKRDPRYRKVRRNRIYQLEA